MWAFMFLNDMDILWYGLRTWELHVRLSGLHQSVELWVAYNACWVHTFGNPLDILNTTKGVSVLYLSFANTAVYRISEYVNGFIEKVALPFPVLSNVTVIVPSVSTFAAAKPCLATIKSFASTALSIVSAPQHFLACLYRFPVELSIFDLPSCESLGSRYCYMIQCSSGSPVFYTGRQHTWILSIGNLCDRW